MYFSLTVLVAETNKNICLTMYFSFIVLVAETNKSMIQLFIIVMLVYVTAVNNFCNGLHHRCLTGF